MTYRPCKTNLEGSLHVKKQGPFADRTIDMKGSIKDLLQIPGVQGYIIAQGKSMQIKLPAKNKFSGAKDRLLLLYHDLVGDNGRPGNTVEILLDDVLLTVFLSGETMLMVVSSLRANQALLRMTGKLIIANMTKE
jgi:hypothetical protein